MKDDEINATKSDPALVFPRYFLSNLSIYMSPRYIVILTTYGHIGTPRLIFGHKTSKNEIQNGGHRLRLCATGLNTNGRFCTYSIIVDDLLVHDSLPFIIWNI